MSEDARVIADMSPSFIIIWLILFLSLIAILSLFILHVNKQREWDRYKTRAGCSVYSQVSQNVSEFAVLSFKDGYVVSTLSRKRPIDSVSYLCNDEKIYWSSM